MTDTELLELFKIIPEAFVERYLLAPAELQASVEEPMRELGRLAVERRALFEAVLARRADRMDLVAVQHRRVKLQDELDRALPKLTRQNILIARGRVKELAG